MAVPSFNWFERLYRYFSSRRRILYGLTLAVIALSSVASSRITLQEDIAAMLPDDGSEAALDFRLLQMAPFSRKVVITLRAENGSNVAGLAAAADRLAQALPSPLITSVATGPQGIDDRFLGWLGRSLPSLATEGDRARLRAWTEPGAVRERLGANYDRLFSPEGWALKESIQSDPLSFSELALEKMRFVNLIPNMRLVDGHFISSDGRSALLLAEASVSMTDSAGARELLHHIETQAGRVLPPGIRCSVVSGHRYTLANAEAVKHDLFLILTLNAAAILAIYIFFLRSLSAVFVFLVPSCILLIASGMLAAVHATVFAVTLGFGGVILGIADEYAMLVYFSCRAGKEDPGAIVGRVSRPVIFGAGATLLSLGVMFLSSLPGQRQLALYAMTGIVASVAVSLVVLPHLVRRLPEDGPSGAGSRRWRFSPPRRLVIGVWLLVLLFCGWHSASLRFDGDLRRLSLVPPDLRQAEAELSATWGEMRGRAMIFVEEKDLDSALRVNGELFSRLAPLLPPGELVSLAPLLPAKAAAERNRAAWRQFWQGENLARVRAGLGREGGRLGFAPDAFDGFLSGLSEPSGTAGIEELREAGLGPLADSLIVASGEGVRVITLVPDTPAALAVVTKAVGQVPGARLVAESRFGDNIGRAISGDFARYLGVTSILVLVMVVFLFRRLEKILLVLVPVATGVACMTGIMGLLDIPFNLFNIVATILIIGLCVDYGIFMVCKLTEGSTETADRAVLVSGLTTLTGFGSLAFAQHPSMHSIGVTVLLGIGTGIPAALLVIPALHRKRPLAGKTA